MNQELETELFDFEEVTDGDVIATPKDPDMPEYGTKEWNDHVMSHFRKDELIDGNPICAGLRRVAAILLGDVIESGPDQIFPATDPNGPGRATVVYSVAINWMNSGQVRVFKEVADVWHGNTDDLFCAHPVATASTRAEGRALRKALGVRCLAAEELARKDIVSIVKQSVQKDNPTDGEWDEDALISSSQINFVDNKCRQLDVNVMAFVNMGELDYEKIDDVEKKKASAMLGVLNKYQTKQTPIPEEVLGYNKNWR
tara:strand:- start:1651 stop:2418 length:768 start_codon:yes stop_codon:yes gene_type:complete